MDVLVGSLLTNAVSCPAHAHTSVERYSHIVYSPSRSLLFVESPLERQNHLYDRVAVYRL